MSRLNRKISGLIMGLIPVTGAIMIGIACMYALGFPGFLILLVLLVLSIWIGYQIYDRVSIVGALEFIAVNSATPQLNNQKPAYGSKTREFDPIAYTRMLEQGVPSFRGGSLRVFGDWFTEPYKEHFFITKATYDRTADLLRIEFHDGKTIELIAPQRIQESDGFMKVIDADQVTISWTENDKSYFMSYKKEKYRIFPNAQLHGISHRFDTSVSEPAIIMYA